ncbi:toll-like receptor 5 [Heteronotia binoei]|uniref:toll-like receptor 5 n=1 Tax=Heteronotia binoei TaxID=13085 RepID=UPI00292FB591|nr:toll-like receptor 5 [Heteronotia binoei]XP_060102068.1 toll-like receptor 5 [Heteronotia binoei]XP_060102075.1 toll-like receptor 5 [Heteronotia binoei]XP_060102076.1 toll-like receptor 5 [Heteronotia binoei]
MLHHLIFLTGMLLVCREILAIPRCSVERSIAYYDMCNLTQVPSVPEDVVTFSLNFNCITEVNVNSFPLLEKLQNLFLGSQSVSPVTIGKEAFKNLPNLQLLDLGGNWEIHLDPDAFVGLLNLSTLRLYYNKLTESILEGYYFQDLVSLEYLDLSLNGITRLHPHPLFYNMTSLKILDFKLNHIETICEGDLDSFQGKDFTLLKLDSNRLYSRKPVDWPICGNPFKNISIETLDISSNGWDVAITQQFLKAIQGVPVQFLKLSHHTMGASYGFGNLKDPDSDTFASLATRGLRLLDISNGFIFSLKSYVFQYLPALEWLDLNNNKVNQIKKSAFFGLRSLKYLNLSYNLLGELLDNVFEGLDNIIYIDLKNNHIGVIFQGPFKDLLKLQTLDLRDNALKQIDSLPPNLLYALLSSNRMGSEINAIDVIFLDLSENRLENLGYLYKLLQYSDLQYAVLRYNRLSNCFKYNNTIPENNKLIYLDLGNNMLRLVWESKLCLDVFKALSKLQVLHLNNNYLSFLPEDIFSGLVSLERLNLSSNLLTYISHGTFPKTLRSLDLSSNQLLYPNPDLFTTLDYLNLTFNRYYCDCPLSSLIVWLNQTNVSIAGSQNEMFCFGPPVLAGVSLYALSVDDCDEDKMLEKLQFALFIFTCVTVTVLLGVGVIFTRFRGTCFMWYKIVTRAFLKNPQPQLDGKVHRYDAYLCYCSTDFEWVQKSLIQHLDIQYSDKNRFTLCFEHRDFLPGEDHIDNIRDAIWNSKKTICVVTKQFLKDGWCVEAFNFAQSQYFCDLKDVLIMVVAGSLSQYQLLKYQPIRVYMQRGHYLRWPADDQDVEWFLNTLSHQILKEKTVKKSRMLELQTITGF